MAFRNTRARKGKETFGDMQLLYTGNRHLEQENKNLRAELEETQSKLKTLCKHYGIKSITSEIVEVKKEVVEPGPETNASDQELQVGSLLFLFYDNA